MIYYNEATMNPEMVYITDEHYGIAEKIHKQFIYLKLSISPIHVAHDKKSLLICVNLEHKEDVDFRVKRECNEYLYKITIEPPKLRQPEISPDEKALKEFWINMEGIKTINFDDMKTE